MAGQAVHDQPSKIYPCRTDVRAGGAAQRRRSGSLQRVVGHPGDTRRRRSPGVDSGAVQRRCRRARSRKPRGGGDRWRSPPAGRLGGPFRRSATLSATQQFVGDRRAFDYLPDGVGALSEFRYIGFADVAASSSAADVRTVFNANPALRHGQRSTRIQNRRGAVGHGTAPSASGSRSGSTSRSTSGRCSSPSGEKPNRCRRAWRSPRTQGR